MSIARRLFLEVVYRHSPLVMLLWGVGAVVIWGACDLLCKQHKRWGRMWICVNTILLAVDLLFILRFTLGRTGRNRAVQLIPFYSFTYPTTSDRYNTVVANMLLCLPLGLSMSFLLVSMKRKHPIRTTIAVGLIFSIFIEAWQYIFALGLCETDDVIFNTLGTAIGTLPIVAFNMHKSVIERTDIRI